MQDRYAGDLGDFSKFALMRSLLADLRCSAGLIWYRFPDESTNNDGRHTRYLGDSRWDGTDPALIDTLQGIIDGGTRSIQALESSTILPADTSYFGESIFWEKDLARNRSDWFKRACAAVQVSDLVMVDPDNGLAGPSHKVWRRKGGKYVTTDEVAALANAHKCVVVYHHFNRSCSHEAQMRMWVEQLSSASPDRNVQVLRYKRVSPRAYFILSRSDALKAVESSVERLCSGAWSYHFERG